MTSAIAWARRRLGPLIANEFSGAFAARIFRNRIPHRGLTIDTSSPVVTNGIKAALLFRGYESSEYRFVRDYLPADQDVVELGGSLGVVSCTIRRKLVASRKLVIVEADPRLAIALKRNLEINGASTGTEIENVAIAYSDKPSVLFALGETSVSGNVVEHADDSTVEVPATTLSALLRKHDISDFCLVCDIEGVEWDIFREDLDSLCAARLIIMETHSRAGFGTHDDLANALMATGRFSLLNRYGAVIVLAPVAAAHC